MAIKRAVADIESDEPARSRAFYVDFLGFEAAMVRDEIITFASPGNPTAQVSVVGRDESSALCPGVSIEVTDVEELHAKAVAQGLQIVYPLADEPWGVRRFFVLDPNGVVINVMSHR